MRKRKPRADVPRGCRNCHGTGYVSVVEIAVDASTGREYQMASVLTCSCPLGAWRKEQFRKREEASTTRQ